MEVTGILTQWIIALLVSSNLANGYSFRISNHEKVFIILYSVRAEQGRTGVLLIPYQKKLVTPLDKIRSALTDYASM